MLVVGRTPKPVPLRLHQSPQACWAVGWTPLRPEECVSKSCPCFVERSWNLTSIHDEVSREASGCEERSQGVDVPLLVAVGVTRGVGGAGGDGEGVVVGDVGGETAD